MIDSILVASDFLMTKEKEQASNRRWLLDLLRRPILEATGVIPQTFCSSLTREDLFSRVRFFELSGIRLDIGATHFWFDVAAITPESLAYLATHLTSNNLLIGYELSDHTKQLLDRIGVPWVDMWLHPIRFLDDILFAFSSSDSSIYEAMKSFHIEDSVFYLYGDRARIQYYKGYRRPDLPIKPGSALFVGQTLEDKAVCDQGRMLNLLDFKGAFERIGAKHGTVYYSRHPYVKSGDEAIRRYVAKCGFAREVDWPAYQMLASGRLAKAFSISSSVIHEARYFSVEAEFLFRPVITYGTDHGADHLSIYQEFVSPHFWAATLAPLLPTRECKRIMFLEQKDKLRDMLNFYWSYRYIDKVEDARQTLAAVDRKLHGLLPKKPAARVKATTRAEPIRSAKPWAAVQSEVEAMMINYKAVSFDIFDTLVERPFEQPNDLFDYLTPRMREVSGLSELDFRKARQEARGLVHDGPSGEEVSLEERYGALAKGLGLSEATAGRMRAIEEEAELELCRPRKAGKALYDAAIRMGRKVVLISDTYFSAEFMARLLEKNGYTDHFAMFLSSSEGKLKHTGNLYPVVLKALDIPPTELFHVGDNAHADIKQAQAAGIKTYQLPRAVESFSAQSRLAGNMLGGGPVLRSVVRGLIANRLADNPLGFTGPSHAGDSPSDFGYAVAGPVFFGFAKWILQNSVADKIEELYFLARDGAIAKRCYDILALHHPEAPVSKYLWASRRGVNVPALETESDVMGMLKVNFTPTTVGNLLRHRFGLESVSIDILRDAAYDSIDDQVDYKRDEAKIRRLLTSLTPQILDNAREERHALLEYYRDMGLMNAKRKAVVDIGHHGTLQASISRLAAQDRLGGYYFATYKEIERTVLACGMNAKGYFADRLAASDSRHPYGRHLLMFEALFLNDEGSFVRMQRANGISLPVMLPTDLEAGRIQFIRRVHDGAVEFVRDAAAVLGQNLLNHPFDAESAVSGYISMLRNPTAVDAMLFDGIGFENLYSGRGTRMVINRAPNDPDKTVGQSLWKEGALILAATMERKSDLLTRLVGEVVRRSVSERKYKKYLNSPRAFFRDSKFIPFAHILFK